MSKGNAGKREKKGSKFGIERKISYNVSRMVVLFNLILGAVGILCCYIATVASVEHVMDQVSGVAADMIAESLDEYTMLAYETGSLTRLADPERSAEEKKELIDGKVENHGMNDGFILDSNGINIFNGEDYSQHPSFAEAMK